MVKDTETVTQESNDLVNMSTSDLEVWLKSESSQSVGRSKEDESGETVGHESNRKIIQILKKTPSKDPEQYDEEDIAHMRRVVAYCKRHMGAGGQSKTRPDR